jgi:hypothetical protein
MRAAVRRLADAASRSDIAARMDPRLRRAAGRFARRIGAWPGGGVPARSNGRLAFVGPVPPAATGIASYDGAVLDGLRRIGFLDRHRTDVLWPVEPRHARVIDRYELAIFQLGNNTSFHRRIYDLAWDVPGLVVLHDLAIDDLVRGLDAIGDDHARDTMREAAVPGHRPTDPDVVLHEPLRIPWCAAIVRRARSAIACASTTTSPTRSSVRGSRRPTSPWTSASRSVARSAARWRWR